MNAAPDFDDFEPAPPSQAEIEQDYRVTQMLGQLRSAAAGDDLVYALSHALLNAASRKRSAPPISSQQRDQLLESAIRAEATAYRVLQGRIAEVDVRAGMLALTVQIIRWASPDAGGVADDTYRDAHLHARIFRNELHNLDLRDMLDPPECQASERLSA